MGISVLLLLHLFVVIFIGMEWKIPLVNDLQSDDSSCFFFFFLAITFVIGIIIY